MGSTAFREPGRDGGKPTRRKNGLQRPDTFRTARSQDKMRSVSRARPLPQMPPEVPPERASTVPPARSCRTLPAQGGVLSVSPPTPDFSF